jgi:hypothetical protein
MVYKGFKGKFIYWGVGLLLSALVIGALTMAMINMYLGAMVMIGIIVLGFFYIGARQKKGLHDKSFLRGIFYPVNQLSKINRYAKAK